MDTMAGNRSGAMTPDDLLDKQVRILRGGGSGETGKVVAVCDDGCSVFVDIPGHRNTAFGEWPVPVLWLEVLSESA